MRNRKLMADKGWFIIVGLLEAYIEMKKVGASLRIINPKNIYVSEDCEHLLLLGIQHVSW